MNSEQSIDANANENTNNAICDDDENNEDSHLLEYKKQCKSRKRGIGINLDGSKRCGRLLLEDALKNIDTMQGWSDARKKAWKAKDKNPNTYFYRFNAPGQAMKEAAKWSNEE